MVSLYARRHMGVTEGQKPDTSAVLRTGLMAICAEFTDEEIEAEAVRLKEQE